MSSKLVTDRKERIMLMLNRAKIRTKDAIEFFEQRVAENPKDNTKEFFNQAVWVNRPKFIGDMALETGLRLKVLEDYFNLLKNAERITENFRSLGENQQFRNCEVVSEYLENHKFNGD